IVTISAALHSKTFDPTSTYTCTGTWQEGGLAQRRDWKVGGHGTLTLVQGLTASCDPWFYHMGLTMGKADFNLVPNMAKAFGLGQLTGIELPDEAAGQVPDPDWLFKTKGETWSLDDSVNMAIGQGNM